MRCQQYYQQNVVISMPRKDLPEAAGSRLRRQPKSDWGWARLLWRHLSQNRWWCHPNMLHNTFENALYWYLFGLKSRWSTNEQLPAQQCAMLHTLRNSRTHQELPLVTKRDPTRVSGIWSVTRWYLPLSQIDHAVSQNTDRNTSNQFNVFRATEWNPSRSSLPYLSLPSLSLVSCFSYLELMG